MHYRLSLVVTAFDDAGGATDIFDFSNSQHLLNDVVDMTNAVLDSFATHHSQEPLVPPLQTDFKVEPWTPPTEPYGSIRQPAVGLNPEDQAEVLNTSPPAHEHQWGHWNIRSHTRMRRCTVEGCDAQQKETRA